MIPSCSGIKPNERKGEIIHCWGLASGAASLAATNPDYLFTIIISNPF